MLPLSRFSTRQPLLQAASLIMRGRMIRLLRRPQRTGGTPRYAMPSRKYSRACAAGAVVACWS